MNPPWSWGTAPIREESAGSGAASADDLQETFVKTLANVVFEGRWTLIDEGVLGPEKPDTYPEDLHTFTQAAWAKARQQSQSLRGFVLTSRHQNAPTF